ncbi:MAG: NmrA family NAD(P)-binding protein [Pseudomonadota bacterium]
MPPVPYVVFGVTGRTGAAPAAADARLRSGHPVRVEVRDPAKGQAWAERSSVVAVADLTDLASITKALSQVQGAAVSTLHTNQCSGPVTVLAGFRGALLRKIHGAI